MKPSNTGPPIASRVNYQFRDVDESSVPSEFKHMGLAWWWGVVQIYLFQMQPKVENLISIAINEIDKHASFSKSVLDKYHPLIGMHVRHGDKSSDGFRDHSLEAEIAAVRKSPECNYHLHPSQNNSSPCMNASTLEHTDIFVASDDSNVLAAARKLGMLVVNSGVSQQTGGNGMFKTLMGHPE